MTCTLDDHLLTTIADLRAFLTETKCGVLTPSSKGERNIWIFQTLLRFLYRRLSRQDQGVVRRYLARVSGLSQSQLTRHIRRAVAGQPPGSQPAKRHSFATTYTAADLTLLLETDAAHERMNGAATRHVFQMAHERGDTRFATLATISVAQLYRLRASTHYRQRATVQVHTRAVQVSIGERRRPDPKGEPGFIRVDTVHQGDRDKKKGVYFIHLIDAVTQWEAIFAVEAISERFMAEPLAAALQSYPYRIQGFHSDNGSEFINHVVAKILNRLHIVQTKSRSRQTNDNALIEGKNASIVRRHLGHHYIPGSAAAELNTFFQGVFLPYLNYSRPCAFPTVTFLSGGKKRTTYPAKDYRTPCERLLEIPHVEQYLRDGVTVASLQARMKAQMPNAAGAEMNIRKRALFKKILHDPLQMLR